MDRRSFIRIVGGSLMTAAIAPAQSFGKVKAGRSTAAWRNMHLD